MKKYDFDAFVGACNDLGISFAPHFEEKRIRINGRASCTIPVFLKSNEKTDFIEAIKKAVFVAFREEGDTELGIIFSATERKDSDSTREFLFGEKKLLVEDVVEQYSREIVFNTEQEKLDFLKTLNEENFVKEIASRLSTFNIRELKARYHYKYTPCLFQKKEKPKSLFIAFAWHKSLRVLDENENLFVFANRAS